MEGARNEWLREKRGGFQTVPWSMKDQPQILGSIVERQEVTMFFFLTDQFSTRNKHYYFHNKAALFK